MNTAQGPKKEVRSAMLGLVVTFSPSRKSSIDSAEWYENEREAGAAIRAFLASEAASEAGLRREDIFFTTKLKSNDSYDATRKAIAASLDKSGLGYIDLFLLHSPYGGREKRLECWRAVEDAVAAGSVKAAGVSNYGIKHVRSTACCLENGGVCMR
jgi:diketogulonate reductase-like aldo/keto reductase